jgi:N-acetylglucosamine-6-phosphate deacetylase
MNGHFIIVHASIVLPEQIIPDGFVLVEEGRIKQFGSGNYPAGEGEKIIDAEGAFVAPGFIDMHSHGAGGFDFMDNTVEAYLGAARMHAIHGTTSLFPTTLAGTNEELLDTFDAYKEAKPLNKQGAAFMGLHLEGPYFSYEQRGAQDPKYLRNPQPKEYEMILASCDEIRRWSIAPELPGALAFGKRLAERGILPSIAHTNATYEEALAAYQSGFTHITHLYSCMSTVTRRNAFRYAGVIEAAWLIDGMTVELIADGVHLPKPLLQLAYKLKGPKKTALCTDSMRAAGMPDGDSILGSLKNGQPVIVEDGVAKLPDRSAFAGSVATTDRLVRTMVHIAEIPLTDAVRMMTLTPAEIMKIDKQKGSIEVGKDADLVVFNQNIDIRCTVIGGNIIYLKQQENGKEI